MTKSARKGWVYLRNSDSYLFVVTSVSPSRGGVSMSAIDAKKIHGWYTYAELARGFTRVEVVKRAKASSRNRARPPKGTLTDTNLFVLKEIDTGKLTFVERRGRLMVEAVSAPHVQRLVAAGALDPHTGKITEEGRRILKDRYGARMRTPFGAKSMAESAFKKGDPVTVAWFGHDWVPGQGYVRQTVRSLVDGTVVRQKKDGTVTVEYFDEHEEAKMLLDSHPQHVRMR